MGAQVMSFLYLLQSLQAAGLEAVATSVGENRRLKPGVPGSKSVMLSGKFWASKVQSYQLIGDSRLYQDVEKGKNCGSECYCQSVVILTFAMAGALAWQVTMITER
ncbi:uncharacterized protein LOC113778706 [Coffea eugenioides]|uniref:uncharacterized protein LOC113778706 n=1 Tax=Coffea eugenioides TaxID=49369 RepID=UPI000F609022|nr:uncharacterized protein LOC113778706 [Coffea eugenioides]